MQYDMKAIKKIKKKAMALILTASMTLGGAVVPVYADTSYGPGDTGSITVTAEINSTYTVELPATIALKPKTNEFDGSFFEDQFNYYITPLFLGGNEAIVIAPGASPISESLAKGSIIDMDEALRAAHADKFTLTNTSDSSKTAECSISLSGGLVGNRYFTLAYAGSYGAYGGEGAFNANDGSTVSRTGGIGYIELKNEDLPDTAGTYEGTVNLSWIKVTME